ncbi:MAG: C40 family peptidase [Elusimicrobia bacterium]|nr:C40 family peptidase [Elusimicrobiota bacterium]
MNAILPRRALGPALAAVLAAGCSSGPPVRPRRALPPVPALAKAVVRTAKSYLPEEEKDRRAPEDCSDYVRRVFLENGLDLPRNSREMALCGDPVKSSQDLRMGDLVFFSGEKVSRAVGHVGIYVNNGVFIHLPSSGVVVMESLYSDYYRARYIRARRVIP